MKKNILSTLFVGIDVSSKTNVLCALDFSGDKLLNLKALNNQPGAETILNSIIGCLNSNSLEYVVIALESTSFYSTHIANFLASDETLLAYKPLVYCLNPKTIANYRKSFVDMDKTDTLDAFVIADFARVGRITCEPWHTDIQEPFAEGARSAGYHESGITANKGISGDGDGSGRKQR